MGSAPIAACGTGVVPSCPPSARVQKCVCHAQTCCALEGSSCAAAISCSAFSSCGSSSPARTRSPSSSSLERACGAEAAVGRAEEGRRSGRWA